jgi:hypothetical protein
MTESLIRESKLDSKEDPESWITNLDDLGFKLKVMGFFTTNYQ